MVLRGGVIGAGRRFKELITVIYEDVWLTEKLRGDGGIVSSTLPGHHAGSERTGRHCALAPVVVMKVSKAAVGGIHCASPPDENCAKIPLMSCRSSSHHVAAALNVVEAREVAIWHLSGSVPRRHSCFTSWFIERDDSPMHIEHVPMKRQCRSTCIYQCTAMVRGGGVS